MPALADMVNGRTLGRVGIVEDAGWTCKVPIGASGATGTLAGQPNGMLVAKSDTGVYAVTVMPITPAAKARVTFGVYSPLLTVDHAVVTAEDNAAGTMSFTTVKAGVATEPASGDYIVIKYEAEPR
jgi:hypothetical protein